MANIIFVCTGNVFRSMSAEFLMRAAAAQKNKDGALTKEFNFASAGTHARPRPGKAIRDDVEGALAAREIDVTSHTPRRLTQEMIDNADLVIAMSTDHLQFIKDEFGHDATLYNEITTGKKDAFLDLWEVIPDHRDRPEDSRRYVESAVNKIAGEAGVFLKNLPKFLP